MKPCTRFNLLRTSIKENPVVDNLPTKEFSIKLSENRFAIVNYKIEDGGTFNLMHSSIPDEYQGLGLGHILAERVFEHLGRNKKNVILTCEFLRKCYIQNQKKFDLSVLDTHSNN